MHNGTAPGQLELLPPPAGAAEAAEGGQWQPCAHDFGPGAAAARPTEHSEARRSLDELVTEALVYRSSKAFRQMLTFVSRFRGYSPFNAFLLHIQDPGAIFVAPASSWRGKYGRRIMPGGRPLAILRPWGPVMFVFDVSDTEPLPGAAPLPSEVERPFDVQMSLAAETWDRTVANIKRDGIRVTTTPHGAQLAGAVTRRTGGPLLEFVTKRRPTIEFIRVPTAYEVTINADHNLATRYATLAHELGHVYCGHLGTPNEKWWPDRSGMGQDTNEFEAEVVSYIVCRRLDPTTRFPPYLHQHLSRAGEVPPIGLARVMDAAGDILEAGERYLRQRPDRRK